MKLFYNANLYDRNENAFVSDNGVFVEFGSREDLLVKYDVESETDLNGGYVYPGFNDSHMHLLNLGVFLNNLNLYEHTSSLSELKRFLKESCDRLNDNEWATGRGFNQDYFSDEKRVPTRSDLDEVSKDKAIFITRACGHIGVLNSKAIELLGINNDISVDGGSINLDTGLFEENALNLVNKLRPVPDKKQVKECLLKAIDFVHGYGITSVQSDDFEVFPALDNDVVIDAYRELEKEGKLTLRVYEQCQLRTVKDLKDFLAKGYPFNVRSDFFSLGPLKILADGSLGAHTAYLWDEYLDDPGNHGIFTHSQDELDELVKTAHDAGMQIACHTIGDKALDMIEESYWQALNANPRDDHRHGVVHLQVSRLQQLERLKQLHAIAYVQSIFIDYDSKVIYDRINKDLASTSYNFKTLMKMGINVSNGSDSPVEMPDVLKGMECGITRCSIDSDVPYLPEEAFDVDEAIRSYTINGAYASFEENKKGLLKEGYLADFTVLNEDIRTADPHNIHNIKVLNTYVNENKVL